MRRSIVGLMAALSVVSTAAAQQRGTFEVGLFPNISYFDRTLVISQGQAGPGARLGFFFTDHFGDPASRLRFITAKENLHVWS